MIVSDAINFAIGSTPQIGAGWYGYLLNQVAQRIRALTTDALAPLQINPPQLRALEAIDLAGPLTQARLGQLVNMDRTSVVHLLDRFEILGLAERNVHRSDRRSHAVVLTAKGRGVLAAAQIRAAAVQDKILAPLSTRDRQLLHRLLVTIVDQPTCLQENVDEQCASPPNA